MVTTHQIRSVLRIYGDQLKKRALQVQDSVQKPRQSSDSVNISTGARKKQMLDQISNKMISQAVRNKGSQQDVREKSLGKNMPSNIYREGNKL